MPNLTFYISAEQTPSEERLAALSRDSVNLCTDVIEAEPQNVHVIYVDARRGHGHPVYVEVRYRLEPFRTPSLMSQFMEALDSAVIRNTGLIARIRCFGYAPSNIYARN